MSNQKGDENYSIRKYEEYAQYLCHHPMKAVNTPQPTKQWQSAGSGQPATDDRRVSVRMKV